VRHEWKEEGHSDELGCRESREINGPADWRNYVVGVVCPYYQGESGGRKEIAGRRGDW